jgi:hypothetical protein
MCVSDVCAAATMCVSGVSVSVIEGAIVSSVTGLTGRERLLGGHRCCGGHRRVRDRSIIGNRLLCGR